MNGCLKLYRLIHGVQEFEISSIFNLMTLAATSLLQLSGSNQKVLGLTPDRNTRIFSEYVSFAY